MWKTNLYKYLLLLFLISAFSIPSDPEEDIWEILTSVGWEDKYNAEFEAKVPYPVFNNDIKSLQGKTVKISGFIIPVGFYGDGGEEYIILSRYPASSCFFCGGGGPESVIEVYLKNTQKTYPIQKVQTIQGKLQLNRGDFDHLIYLMKDAEVL